MIKNIVDKYLNDEYIFDLYLLFIERHDFNPKEYLNTYFSQIFTTFEFVKKNKRRPLTVLDHIEKVVQGLQLILQWNFYEFLLAVLCNEFDITLHPCIKLIDRAYKNGEEQYKKSKDWVFLLSPADFYFEDYAEYCLLKSDNYKGDGNVFSNRWVTRKGLKESVKKTSPEAHKVLEESILKEVNLIEVPESNIQLTSSSTEIYLTEKEQGLFFYYLKIARKLGSNTTGLNYARLIEQLLNKKSPSIENSNIYRYSINQLRIKDAIKSIEVMIGYLEKVKNMFESINEKEVANVIQLDINKLINSLAPL